MFKGQPPSGAISSRMPAAQGTAGAKVVIGFLSARSPAVSKNLVTWFREGLPMAATSMVEMSQLNIALRDYERE
jgi:hypothetical protein